MGPELPPLGEEAECPPPNQESRKKQKGAETPIPTNKKRKHESREPSWRKKRIKLSELDEWTLNHILLEGKELNILAKRGREGHRAYMHRGTGRGGAPDSREARAGETGL